MEKALSTIEIELKRKPFFTILSKRRLIKINEKLQSLPHKQILLQKPQYFYSNWKVGDVFSLRLENDKYIDFNLQGRFILIMNVGNHITFPKNICPKIICLNWHGEKPLFDLSRISELDVLPTFFFNQYRNYKIFVFVEDEKSLFKSNLTYIGNIAKFSLPDHIARDIDDDSRKKLLSIELLKSGMIPISQYVKMNFKINPDGNHII
jgi:hypothetical protein